MCESNTKLEINKYRIRLFDANGKMIKSNHGIKAASGEEAIESVRKEPFWYAEGTGYAYHKISYPITFVADIYND